MAPPPVAGHAARAASRRKPSTSAVGAALKPQAICARETSASGMPGSGPRAPVLLAAQRGQPPLHRIALWPWAGEPGLDGHARVALNCGGCTETRCSPLRGLVRRGDLREALQASVR